MHSDSHDLTITSVLADPMIRALMSADHVNRGEFESLLRDKARTLRAVETSRTGTVRCTAPDKGWLPRVCFA